MNNEDFLKLLNEVAKIAKPFNDDYVDATAMTDKLVDCGLDSLDMLLTGVYLCDIFHIDEEISKTLQPATVQELHDFLMLHHTKMPDSVEEALKDIK